MLGKALLSFSILGWSKICSVASYMDGLKGIDIAISRSRYTGTQGIATNGLQKTPAHSLFPWLHN